MKTLIINGSPRRDSKIRRILDEIAAELDAKGHEIKTVDIARLTVSPCTGCMACRSTLNCVLPQDDAQSVLLMIDWCDALIIGSPCYWGNIPGQLKSLFDRMVYGMIGKSSSGIPIPLHRGKKAAIVATCTMRWPWNRLFHQSSGVVRSLKEILKWSGFKVIASIQRGDTNRRPITDKDLRKARRLAHKFI